jgi:pyridoxine 4-dehydrogenase
LKALVEKGLFDHIGLSEVSAQTLKRAHAIYPISIVEIEVSPWSMEEETRKGRFPPNIFIFDFLTLRHYTVIATAAELNVTVAAYA